MAILSWLQFARRHVCLFRGRYIRRLCSCAESQYTRAKAGVVHWSAWSAAVESKRENILVHPEVQQRIQEGLDRDIGPERLPACEDRTSLIPCRVAGGIALAPR